MEEEKRSIDVVMEENDYQKKLEYYEAKKLIIPSK